MDDQDQKVGAISTFLQRLDKLVRSKGNILYYRGHSKSSYQLTPSIYRNEGWINNEGTMLKELMLRCPNDFSGGLSTFQILVKMQHYSLPTRLLDLTSNPLVSLYFACVIHDDDEDGEVIVLSFDINQVKYFDSDTVSVISNISRRPAGFSVPSTVEVKAFNEAEDIKLLLHDIRQDKPYFEPKIQPDHLGKVVCVKPMLDNPRIIRQDGAFLLFGINGEKTKPAQLESSSVIERIRINKTKKKEMLVQLENLGISQATLFPEIEQVATHIKVSYKLQELQLIKQNTRLSRTLEVVSQDPAISIQDIAKRLNVTDRTVMYTLRELNEMGLIENLGGVRHLKSQTKHNPNAPK
jgi:hypothetical protein